MSSVFRPYQKPVKLALPKAKTVTAQESNQLRNAMRKLDFNKGLVTDSKTGLMWMSCTLGMDSIGNGCYGGARELLWEEALTVSKKTSFGGYKDWRLPSIAELNSIVSCGNGRVAFEVDSQEHYVEKNGKSYNGRCLPGNSTPSIDAQVFSNTKSEGVYWTNAQSKSNSFNAWVVLFNKGLVAKYSKRLPGYVRLVRTYK